MLFEEIEIVCDLGPGHPDYVKPDIGAHCYVMYKQFVSWKHVQPSCVADAENPENWTIIITPLGRSTVNMPYKQVKKRIEEAYFFFEEERKNEFKAALAEQLEAVEARHKAHNG